MANLSFRSNVCFFLVNKSEFSYCLGISCNKLTLISKEQALRLILQYGVKPKWFNTCSTITDKGNSQISRTLSADLRSYLIDVSPIGDSVVPELLLKALEPYRREGKLCCIAFFLVYIVEKKLFSFFSLPCLVESGCVLDDERVRQYAAIITKGSAARFSFAAAIFGDTSEACFWLQLPRALKHLLNMLANKSLQKLPVKLPSASIDDTSILSRMFTIKGRSVAGATSKNLVVRFLVL